MVDPSFERQIRGQLSPPQVNETQDVQMGRSVELTRDGNPRAEVIRSPGTSVGARMVTVHAFVAPPNPGDFPPPLDPFVIPGRSLALVGELQWGQGGASFTAEIDIRNGAAASVVAAEVALTIGYEPQINPFVFDPPDPAPDQRALRAVVSGALVWGTRPGWCQATRTRVYNIPAADPIVGFSFVSLPIPRWACSVSLLAIDEAWYARDASEAILAFHSGPFTPAPIPFPDGLDFAISPLVAGGAPALARPPGLTLSNAQHFLTIGNFTDEPQLISAVYHLGL